MDESPQLMKVTGYKGERVKMICRAYGTPNISFFWSREGVHLTNGDRYTSNSRSLDNVTWESTLEVASVRSSDYGQYDCHARNKLGTSRSKVILLGTSLPDQPSDFRILNVTHESVDLVWQPGFDGGLPQAYRIRFRQVLSLTYELL